MTHNFRPWTPPPGAVVGPPVHPETVVSVIFSSAEVSDDWCASSFNWSAEGDGPHIVAYAVVQEYKPEPRRPREMWVWRDSHDRIKGYYEQEITADYVRFLAGDEIIHFREVPDPSREVVGWAVMKDGYRRGTWSLEQSANYDADGYGGTVVRLSGVMPS
jgi:hypothetical protein